MSFYNTPPSTRKFLDKDRRDGTAVTPDQPSPVPTPDEPAAHLGEGHHGSYLRFFAMIGTAVVVMCFLTYLNSYQILAHARFSETRVFMALMMGAAMMVIMLGFMRAMYKNDKMNAAIFIGAGLLFFFSLWLVRSQVTVTGVDYMEAMIPHHSIAILTSERAGLEDSDPRVRELAEKIIESQRQEIREMEWLIEDIRTNGIAHTAAEADARPVPDFSETPE